MQVSLAGHPEVIREKLGIAEEFRILCGMSIGYPKPEFAANGLHTPRVRSRTNDIFVDS